MIIGRNDIPVKFIPAHWNHTTNCMIPSYWTPDLQGMIDIYRCPTSDEAKYLGVELIHEGLAYLD